MQKEKADGEKNLAAAKAEVDDAKAEVDDTIAAHKTHLTELDAQFEGIQKLLHREGGAAENPAGKEAEKEAAEKP